MPDCADSPQTAGTCYCERSNSPTVRGASAAYTVGIHFTGVTPLSSAA